MKYLKKVKTFLKSEIKFLNRKSKIKSLKKNIKNKLKTKFNIIFNGF